MPLPLLAGAAPVWRHATLGPFVAGLWRARIILPGALVDEGADPQARDWILRHEVAHVQRRDPWITTLLQLACTLAWPILPVWLAARRIRSLMEEACDERAVAGADGAARRRYGEVLLALAEGRLPSGRLAHVLAFGSPLRARLQALSLRRRWPVALQGLAVSVLGAVALACGGESASETQDGAPSDGGDAATLAHQLSSRREPPPQLAAGAQSVASPEQAAAKRLARIRQTAPMVRIAHDGVWLHTPRRGSVRTGGWKPLETALREALEETGSRAILVESFQRLPYQRVEEVLAAARRAGATEHAVSLIPAPTAPRQPPRLPSAEAGAPDVPFRHQDPVLTVTASGDMYLGVDRVTADNLESALRRWLAHSKTHTLLIRGERRAFMSSAVDIMAIAKRAGATNVGLLSATPPPDAKPSGSLDKEIIRGVIADHMGDVKACYEDQLVHQPQLEGRVIVRFTIQSTGDVERSVVVDTTRSLTAVGDCLAKVIPTWRFPAPEGGGIVVVAYPFKFMPKAP